MALEDAGYTLQALAMLGPDAARRHAPLLRRCVEDAEVQARAAQRALRAQQQRRPPQQQPLQHAATAAPPGTPSEAAELLAPRRATVPLSLQTLVPLRHTPGQASPPATAPATPTSSSAALPASPSATATAAPPSLSALLAGPAARATAERRTATGPHEAVVEASHTLTADSAALPATATPPHHAHNAASSASSSSPPTTDLLPTDSLPPRPPPTPPLTPTASTLDFTQTLYHAVGLARGLAALPRACRPVPLSSAAASLLASLLGAQRDDTAQREAEALLLAGGDPAVARVIARAGKAAPGRATTAPWQEREGGGWAVGLAAALLELMPLGSQRVGSVAEGALGGAAAEGAGVGGAARSPWEEARAAGGALLDWLGQGHALLTVGMLAPGQQAELLRSCEALGLGEHVVAARVRRALAGAAEQRGGRWDAHGGGTVASGTKGTAGVPTGALPAVAASEGSAAAPWRPAAPEAVAGVAGEGAGPRSLAAAQWVGQLGRLARADDAPAFRDAMERALGALLEGLREVGVPAPAAAEGAQQRQQRRQRGGVLRQQHVSALLRALEEAGARPDLRLVRALAGEAFFQAFCPPSVTERRRQVLITLAHAPASFAGVLADSWSRTTVEQLSADVAALARMRAQALARASIAGALSLQHLPAMPSLALDAPLLRLHAALLPRAAACLGHAPKPYARARAGAAAAAGVAPLGLPPVTHASTAEGITTQGPAAVGSGSRSAATPLPSGLEPGGEAGTKVCAALAPGWRAVSGIFWSAGR